MKRKEFIYNACTLAMATLLPFNRLFAKTNSSEATLWHELLDYARWCPSPHNVQPWKVKIISKTEAHLYYDPARVPGAVDIQSAFTIVGMGMFIECLNIVALSKGYKIAVTHEQEPQLSCAGTEFRPFATMSLMPTDEKSVIAPQLIKDRRTSRAQYNGREIDTAAIERFKVTASGYGYEFVCTEDHSIINYIIDLNNETELERSDDKPTMDEMKKWIRISDKEAAEKKDRLWYRCLETHAKVLHNFAYHHERFRHAWKRKIVKNMLNKGMKGTANMAWITGAFDKRADWLQAGTMLQQMWLDMTKENIYMHPLGTVVTTADAKEKFMTTIGYDKVEEKLWFLVRLGYSEEPQRSYRLGLDDILM